MLEENFPLLIALVALLYSLITRVLQFKLGNQKEMEALQKQSKVLNEEFKQAQKDENQARMDLIMEKQKAHLGKMGPMMMGQFKVMAVILVFFFGFMWVIDAINPFVQDDILLRLVDDGSGCDSIPGDSIYSGCHTLSNIDNVGPWVATVSAYDSGGGEFAKDSTYFIHQDGLPDLLPLVKEKDPIEVNVEKTHYSTGETVKITAIPSKNASKLTAVLNNATWFYVDLPFTIPLLNVQRISQPYWWFIFVTIIAGLIITPLYKKYRKIKGE